MNKKSAIKTMLIIIVFFLTIAITIGTLTWLRYISTSKTQAVEDSINKINQEGILLNYLRAPVEISAEDIEIINGMNIAELIVYTLNDQTLTQKLYRESERILTPIFEKPFFWGIQILSDDKLIFSLVQQEYISTVEYDEVQSFEQIIPNYAGKSPRFYKIKLTIYED